MKKPSYLSDKHWASLSDQEKHLYSVVRPFQAAWTVDVSLSDLEGFLDGSRKDVERFGGKLDLCPDFQRGHVWQEAQQVAYVESLIRKKAPLVIQFNCRAWSDISDRSDGDIPPHHLECVDGLQRLTSIRRFMAGEISIFGGLTADDLKGSPFSPVRMRIQVQIHEFCWRQELLQYYLDFNTNGTPHSPSEIARVQSLLVGASNSTDNTSK